MILRSHESMIPNAASGALAGAILGLILAAGLGIVALRGGEAWELATILAAVLGVPVSAVGTAFESVVWPTWVVLLTVPLNGALIGAIVGAGAHAVGWHCRAVLAGIPPLWVGILLLTALWVRTH